MSQTQPERQEMVVQSVRQIDPLNIAVVKFQVFFVHFFFNSDYFPQKNCVSWIRHLWWLTSPSAFNGKWFVHYYPPLTTFAACYIEWESSVTCPASSWRSTHQRTHTFHLLYRYLSKAGQPKWVVSFTVPYLHTVGLHASNVPCVILQLLVRTAFCWAFIGICK